MTYKVNYLSSIESIGKNSGKPYWKMTILITILDGGKVVRSYSTSVFIDASQYAFLQEIPIMQELDFVCVPSASSGIQIIQLDIAG